MGLTILGRGGFSEILCLRAGRNLSPSFDSAAGGMRPKKKATLIDAVAEGVARRLRLCWMMGEWENCYWPW